MTPRLAPLLLLLALLAPMAPVSASEAEVAEALDGLSGKAIKQLVDEITDPKMLGRRTGQPGGSNIEEWVAQKFAEYGMHPADQAGAYLEPYSFAATHVNAPIGLSIAGKAKTYGTDFVHIEDGVAGKVTAPLVYCGYGIRRPDAHWDDYAGVDVKGKIVLIRTGVASGMTTPADRRHGFKVATAASLGAVGCLLFDVSEEAAPRVLSLLGLDNPATIPALSVSNRLVDALLKAQGSSLADVLKKDSAAEDQASDGSMRPGTARALAVNATIEVHTKRTPKALGHNVLARFDGRDPDLKHEVILFCAPADHLGVAPNGAAISGADQSGSPLAVLLHLADLFSLNKYRPTRTIVFCALTGCAVAAHGAEALAARPPFPGTIVATVHCGPVGRRPAGDRPLTVWRYGPRDSSAMGKLIQQEPSAQMPKVINLGDLGNIWNRNVFVGEEIPSFWLTTWPNAPYHHTLVDTADKVQAASLETAAHVLGRWLIALGSAKQPLAKQAAAAPK